MPPKQIKDATTKELQAIYKEMTGKPTTNRNAKALRARLLGMLAERKKSKRTAPKPERREKAALAKKPARAEKRASRSHADSETRRLFAELTPGQTLSHRFRSGSGYFELSCTVKTPPGLDGKGGEFIYDGKSYSTPREVIDAMGAPKWHPALFFKLREYWPHKSRVKS